MYKLGANLSGDNDLARREIIRYRDHQYLTWQRTNVESMTDRSYIMLEVPQ